MYSFQPTKGWHKSSTLFLESNPVEMGLIWANLMIYSALLSVCPAGVRPQMEGLVEEDMGIITIRQLQSSVANILLAYLYQDHSKQLVTLVAIGKEDDKNSDMEYTKKCVTAYLS